MLSRIGLVVSWVLLGSCSVLAQDVVQETRTSTSSVGTMTETRRISQIVGSSVSIQGDTSYGKVEDVVLNNDGGIGYLVVAKGDRYALMPWNAARVNYGRRIVTYDVAPQTVQPLFFDQNAWPTISDQQFTTRMQRVFPNAKAVQWESLQPVQGVVPASSSATVKEKTRIRPNGSVQVKEKVKVKP